MMDPDFAFIDCMDFISDEKNSIHWYKVPEAECLRLEWEPDLYCTGQWEWCPKRPQPEWR